MINKNEAIILAEEFLDKELSQEDWYKKIKSYIKATILYGSVAQGTNSSESDIDILLILPLTVEEKYTQGEYFYNYEGQVFNIVLRSIERLRKIAKEQNSEFQKVIFRKSVIIYATDTEVEELLKEILK